MFQIIEAEEEVLKALIIKITKDKRHKMMTILYHIEIEARDFRSWALAYRIPKGTLRLTGKEFEDFNNYIEDPVGFEHPLSRKVQTMMKVFEEMM